MKISFPLGGTMALAALAVLADCRPATPDFWAGSAEAASRAPVRWRAWQEKAAETRTDRTAETIRSPHAPAPPDLTLLTEVQARINRVPFVEDRVAWGREDVWAQPEDFLARGGDCEDFALAKLSRLRAAGWPEVDLRLLLVQDMQRGGIEHAVLWARLDGREYLLDNQTPGLLEARAQHRYLPRYGMNAGGFWRY